MSGSKPEAPAWRVLLSYVRPYRWALVGGGLLSLANGATGLALPLVVRELIGDLGAGRSVSGWLLLMAGLVVANAGIGAVGVFVMERTGESVVLGIRQRLVARLIRLRLSAAESAEPGDLMSRITADTTLLRSLSTRSVVSFVTATLTLLATLALMGLMDLVLLGVTVLVLASVTSVVRLVVPRIRRASKQAQDAVGVMGAALERTFGAFRTVKASGAEDREDQRLQAAAVDSWRAGVRAAKWSALARTSSGLAVQASFVAVLSVGGARVASGAIDVGTLVAFLLYVFYLMAPFQELIGGIAEYHVGAAAIARIQEAERLPTESYDRPGRIPSPVNGPATVTFEEVRFRYGPGLPEVHHGVSFAIPARGMTALVGPSGAGKTTVFSLVERFYEADSGRVLVDGTDVGCWALRTLRAAIGYVEQDTPVLSGSLRNNLLFGAPNATDHDLHLVLETTRLDGLVDRLPDGLDTQVGHRGVKISGGERQRVAIARALLRRPRLLLLDEATSQLDAVNEAALRDTVAEAAKTTTVLVVAHRLSTVTMADRIIVMDAGVVRAIGTHRELAATDPLYGELAATQFLATTEHPGARR
jgi:ABC-type multidrug transport system fused ATPase/permease subunit